MRLTPHKLMQALRLGAALLALATPIALAGPFKYKDLGLPFPDTVAHALLFYALTLAAFAALPRSRAQEVALSMIGVGLLSEVVQSLVGREMSLHDVVGDTIGVFVAYAPIAISRLRELARTHPHETFAEIRRNDRRRQGSRRPAPAFQEPTP
ncbi:MAG: VanZ family protein [Pseudomonadota bacterium]